MLIVIECPVLETIVTNASNVNFDIFALIASDKRGRLTPNISAASSCLKWFSCTQSATTLVKANFALAKASASFFKFPASSKPKSAKILSVGWVIWRIFVSNLLLLFLQYWGVS